MHYQGDIRDVVSLQLWEAAYLFPPCFQQLRGDIRDCLAYKLADGRAFRALPSSCGVSPVHTHSQCAWNSRIQSFPTSLN